MQGNGKHFLWSTKNEPNIYRGTHTHTNRLLANY